MYNQSYMGIIQNEGAFKPIDYFIAHLSVFPVGILFSITLSMYDSNEIHLTFWTPELIAFGE